jgi:hypothetical protein
VIPVVLGDYVIQDPLISAASMVRPSPSNEVQYAVCVIPNMTERTRKGIASRVKVCRRRVICSGVVLNDSVNWSPSISTVTTIVILPATEILSVGNPPPFQLRDELSGRHWR